MRSSEPPDEWFPQPLNVGAAALVDVAPELKKPRAKRKPPFQFGFCAPPPKKPRRRAT